MEQWRLLSYSLGHNLYDGVIWLYTTRMHFATIFVMQICVTHEQFSSQKKNIEYNSLPQSILVLVIKLRHHANALLKGTDSRYFFTQVKPCRTLCQNWSRRRRVNGRGDARLRHHGFGQKRVGLKNDVSSDTKREAKDAKKSTGIAKHTKFRFKWTSPYHIKHHLISILIKSCSARGRSDQLPKQIKRCKGVRTLMYFKLDRRKFKTQ